MIFKECEKIDIETLPTVKELRDKLARYEQAEKDGVKTMNLENLKKFVDFAWDFITDLPCGLDVLPDDWEVNEDGENLVVDSAFRELKEAEAALKERETK